MRKRLIIVICLIGCLFVTGCANRRLLLRKGQKEIALKPGEGGVLFSLKIVGQTTFNPQSIIIKEINQYKAYKKKQPEFIPIVDASGDLHLVHMKLPQGIYTLSSFYGWFGGFYGNYQYMSCNKIFDVVSGEITYLGRVGSNIYAQGNSWANEVLIRDFYPEDTSILLRKYPILEGMKISKDLFY